MTSTKQKRLERTEETSAAEFHARADALVPLIEKRAEEAEKLGHMTDDVVQAAKILPGLTLYAQAGYQFAVSGTDGGTRDGVRGDLGVRYTW